MYTMCLVSIHAGSARGLLLACSPMLVVRAVQREAHGGDSASRAGEAVQQRLFTVPGSGAGAGPELSVCIERVACTCRMRLSQNVLVKY